MNEIKDLIPLLEANLKTHLSWLRPTQELFYEALEYAVLPAGKLFRPLLCASSYADHHGLEKCAADLRNPLSDISLCCSALEIHHAYTLVHDDLPCMDDDDMRRGRPSTHKKYGQWQAVLVGDALLQHSNGLLARLENPKKALTFFNWALGAKGLILGQVFDLGGEINKSFERLLQTHLGKTARLIQTSLYLGHISAKGELSFKENKDILKWGESIGVSFQLLDDLSEACEELSPHELEVNPFINFPKESFERLYHYMRSIHTLMESERSPYLNSALNLYFQKMKTIVEKDLSKEESLIIKYFGDLKEEDYSWDQLIALL